MSKMHSRFGLLAGVVCAIAACSNADTVEENTAASRFAITTKGVSSSLSLTSDWGAGYCADVKLTNGGTTAVTNWTATLSVGSISISSSWNGTFALAGSTLTVNPLSYSKSIGVGQTVSFGFCATGSARPSVTALNIVGGTPSGTGGAPATGGAKATGGRVATGGTSATSTFVNGPCVTTTDLSSAEVFARGAQNIYRRVITSGSYGAWAATTGLDVSRIDVRSRLDCSSNATTVNIVASGASTLSYQHATGFGQNFNPFSQELASTTPNTFLSGGVSIATMLGMPDQRFAVAAVNTSYAAPIWRVLDQQTPILYMSSAPISQLVSAPDTVMQQGPDEQRIGLVAFNQAGALAYLDFRNAYSLSCTETDVAPPATKTFSYSPTVCGLSMVTGGTSDYTRNIAAVAGGRLYYAASTSADLTPTVSFSAWTQVGSVNATSAPDCVALSDGSVHIVVRTATGAIADVHRTGKTGSWVTTNLGTY